ncbi:MAG TPA: GMC family oxidoreductase N-terminal domain-containing protein [Kofleriaceae bacterium]|nr:GMC family oxidoreductase N-terminal domain-containing protein [Kofleriaceae bacterium]
MNTLGPFDYVIVGGGTAGCVLANRLSADPSVTVLLLEAGGRDKGMWIHIPVGYLFCIGNPRTDWCYRTEPDPGLNGRTILDARGRVLGGCTSINAMLYMRGQARDYDEWAQITGDASWSWHGVLPIFKGTESYWRGGDDVHGADGEWRVERQRLTWSILDAWRDAAEEVGIPKIDDFNRGDNEGSSRFEVNQRRGVRWNATKAFLRPVEHRKNLTVLTGAPVHRVRFGRTAAGAVEALGVEIYRGDEVVFAEARRETLLAAGAIGSPHILQFSGVGPADHLRALGIAVEHDLPGVGGNLQDHLQLRTAFKVQDVLTLNTLANSWWGKMKMGLEYLFRRTGPLTMAPSQMGACTRSDPHQATANIEFHVQPLSLDKFGDPLHTFPAFTVSVCNLRPSSRGHVRLKTPEPRAAPAIQLNYLSTADDQRIAVQSLRLARRIVTTTETMRKYAPEEILPGPAFQTDAELVTAAGNVGTTIFHPIGTCRMGRADDPAAVVDSRLRVRGVARLRVIDASIMPTITSGNTASPTIMIAEKGAAAVLEDARA